MSLCITLGHHDDNENDCESIIELRNKNPSKFHEYDTSHFC